MTNLILLLHREIFYSAPKIITTAQKNNLVTLANLFGCTRQEGFKQKRPHHCEETADIFWRGLALRSHALGFSPKKQHRPSEPEAAMW